MILYDASGATVRFKKNTDGTYTLSKWKSGAKETYDASGKLTKAGATLWQAKDSTGRTASYALDSGGNLTGTTDTEGKTVTFGNDSSNRISKITTAQGRVTVFSYDDVNRVTSMLRATGFNGSGDSGPTWTYSYSAASATAAGTTTAKDPELHATAYKHDGDGQVTDVTDALQRKRSTKFDANHNIDTATDAMGSGTTPGNVTDYGFNSRNNLETAKTPTGALTTNHWQTIAGGDHPSDSANADGEKTTFGYDSVGNTTSVAQTGTGGGNVTYDYNPATTTCGGFEDQRCSAKTRMTSSKTVATGFPYDAQGNLDRVTPRPRPPASPSRTPTTATATSPGAPTPPAPSTTTTATTMCVRPPPTPVARCRRSTSTTPGVPRASR